MRNKIISLIIVSCMVFSTFLNIVTLASSPETPVIVIGGVKEYFIKGDGVSVPYSFQKDFDTDTTAVFLNGKANLFFDLNDDFSGVKLFVNNVNVRVKAGKYGKFALSGAAKIVDGDMTVSTVCAAFDKSDDVKSITDFYNAAGELLCNYSFEDGSGPKCDITARKVICYGDVYIKGGITVTAQSFTADGDLYFESDGKSFDTIAISEGGEITVDGAVYASYGQNLVLMKNATASNNFNLFLKYGDGLYDFADSDVVFVRKFSYSKNAGFVSDPLSYKSGDINADGVTDLTDAGLLANYLVGKKSFSHLLRAISDVNCDGVSDINDVIRITFIK